MTDTAFDLERLASPTGADLALYTREAETAPLGIVHINHGLADRAVRYAGFAAVLAARGYHVAAHDHRGHGTTVAPDGAPRRFADENGWDKVIADVGAVQDAARQRWGDLPLIVFGHSMGSVIAMNYVLRHPQSVAGAGIWNGNMALGGLKGVMRFVLSMEALFKGGRFAESSVIDALTFKAWNKRFPEGRTDADWLTRDTEKVDAYVADPLCGWPAQVSLWRDFLDGVAFAEDNANLRDLPRTLPFHLVGGARDPATNNGAAVKDLYLRLTKAGLTDVECHVVEDFRHETINEIGGEVWMSAFADWLDSVTARAR